MIISLSDCLLSLVLKSVKLSVRFTVKSSVKLRRVYFDGVKRDLPSVNSMSLASANCILAADRVCFEIRNLSQIITVEHAKGIFQFRLLHSFSK